MLIDVLRVWNKSAGLQNKLIFQLPCQPVKNMKRDYAILTNIIIKPPFRPLRPLIPPTKLSGHCFPVISLLSSLSGLHHRLKKVLYE